MAERVIIFDTTLRDGEQSPGASMNVAEKVRLAIQLERLGVDVIEAGFPRRRAGTMMRSGPFQRRSETPRSQLWPGRPRKT